MDPLRFDTLVTERARGPASCRTVMSVRSADPPSRSRRHGRTLEEALKHWRGVRCG
jgi:hypothetical protein